MLKFGPYRHTDNDHWNNPEGDWNLYDGFRAGVGPKSLCGEGMEQAFPGLDKTKLYEFRLCVRKPTSGPWVRAEVQAWNEQYYIGNGLYNTTRKLAIGIEDPEYDEDVNSHIETKFDSGHVVELQEDLHDPIVKAVGISWRAVSKVKKHENVGKKLRIPVYFKAVETGVAPIDIDEVYLETANEKDIEIALVGRNGERAIVRVDPATVEWDL